jgi:uncharacterized protein (DUF302 family)
MTTTHFNTEHIVMSSNQPYDQVIQALEAQLGQGNELEAVFQHVYESHASWEQVTQSIEPLVGSSGFLIFSKLDDTVLLSLAGKPTKARLYILGNPLIAIQMMQHVPEVALYVPLRLVVYQDEQGRVFAAYDRPSSVLGPYQHEAIVRVSELLDQKLAVLVARAVQTPK